MCLFNARLARLALRHAVETLAQAIVARGIRKAGGRWVLWCGDRWEPCSFKVWCSIEGKTIMVDGKAVRITPTLFHRAKHEIYCGRRGPGASS